MAKKTLISNLRSIYLLYNSTLQNKEYLDIIGTFPKPFQSIPIHNSPLYQKCTRGTT